LFLITNRTLVLNFVYFVINWLGNPNSSNSTKSYKSVRFSPGLTGSPTPPRINSDSNGQMSSGVNQNQTPDYMPEYQPEDNETYTFTVFNAATRSFNESTNPGK